MKYSKLFFTWILICGSTMLFFACKKDKTPDSDLQTLLTKVTSNVLTLTYSYDDENRATSFMAEYTNPINNYSGTYSYNGAGQLSEILYEFSSSTYKEVFSYNVSGQISGMESYDMSGTAPVLAYSTRADYNTPGKVTVGFRPAGGVEYLYIEYFLDANSNILKQITYSSLGFAIDTYEYSNFDNNHYPSLSVPQNSYAKNKNNYSTVVTTPTGGTATTGTYVFVFNDDGYPTKRTSNSGSITTYEYRKQ